MKVTPIMWFAGLGVLAVVLAAKGREQTPAQAQAAAATAAAKAKANADVMERAKDGQY